jgi:diguanylate cyclase (GGDEF)-like protein/PAS domain S-box-containing protein
MQLVPGSRISEFDARQRMSIYQKENFQSLPIQQVVDENISDLFLIAGEDSPHLLERRQLDEFGLTVFLENDLPELWSLEKERTLVFMILSIVGIFLTLFSAISIAYLKKIRQANIALLDSKESLRIAATAFETHDAIMITDANNKILKVNEAFQKISGYSAEEVIGKTPRIMSSGRHDEEFYNDMWSELLNRGSWLGEVWDRRKNGEIYPKWLAITAVKNESGETTEYVAIFSDITSRKKAEDEIHNLAFYDPLTQLPNRRLLLDRLRQALILSIRNKRNGAVLFIDLDKFKELNDSLGHEIGDLLLMQAATRILACVRESDTVARLGGDEFVVVLTDLKDNPNEAAAQSKQIGRKILDELGLVYVLANHECHSGGSIGIALFNEHSKETEDLLKEADIAMYQAKKAGRNTLRFFDPQMQEAILERVAFERDLNQAVAQNEFYLCYQGIVSSESKVVGAEALIRWRHAKRGIVSPAEFIPLAEETGLILMIGNWVLNTACAQLVEWAARPETSALTIAVNVSARQFKQDDFVTQVVEVLEQTGANPQRLKLELTESMLVSDVESTIAKMRSLKACGVSFSLDDFGTGYSSLAYLRQLPLDTLKIDQSFVRKIETDDSAVVICAATISLAHNLNLKVVAEGVENLAQSYFLSSVHKCDYLQGYQFSKPVPIEEFESFIKLNSGRIKI